MGVIKSKRGVLKEYKLTDINNQMCTSLHEENNLERDVIDEFYDWKRNHNDLVLYVKGPRQVGKTTEIMKFAYKFYDQVIYINLASEDDLRLFEEIMSTGHMKFGLIRYCRMSNNFEYNDSKNTVLIIDEIQESSRIYNKIRIFQKELRCDVIVTGSYLGATLNNKFFVPMGNLYDIEMLPLSFKEFCRALDLEDELLNISLYGKSNSKSYERLTKAYQGYIESPFLR